jgi:hypothetical protein
MPQFTNDVCQMIVSGQPINNFANTIFYNDLTGQTGILYSNNIIGYQNTLNLCSGLEVSYTYRWDDPTYYG